MGNQPAENSKSDTLEFRRLQQQAGMTLLFSSTFEDNISHFSFSQDKTPIVYPAYLVKGGSRGLKEQCQIYFPHCANKGIEDSLSIL